MKPELAASFVAALLLHGLVLFGFRMETPARPLAMSEEETAPVDVSLVETAPEPPAAAAPAPTPEPAEPQPTPDSPAPPPEMPTPEPPPEQETIPSPESTPIPDHPKPAPHRPQQKHSAPHSVPGAAALEGAASHGAAAGPLSSHARYLNNPKPEYPEGARQMRQQGVVELNVLVGADGRPAEVGVSRSSGFPMLDTAAVQAVRRWIFEPARAGGLPVSSRVEVPVRFSLAD
jgi:protein TonB